MRKVTLDDVNACIREYGLYGWSTSDLRQLVREPCPYEDRAAEIKRAAARHVLVAKLNRNDVSLTGAGAKASLLSEYTRLHEELADMLTSGRATEAKLKDDYHWLIDALERINWARIAAGLDEVPFVDRKA